MSNRLHTQEVLKEAERLQAEAEEALLAAQESNNPDRVVAAAQVRATLAAGLFTAAGLSKIADNI